MHLQRKRRTCIKSLLIQTACHAAGTSCARASQVAHRGRKRSATAPPAFTQFSSTYSENERQVHLRRVCPRSECAPIQKRQKSSGALIKEVSVVPETTVLYEGASNGTCVYDSMYCIGEVQESNCVSLAIQVSFLQLCLQFDGLFVKCRKVVEI